MTSAFITSFTRVFPSLDCELIEEREHLVHAKPRSSLKAFVFAVSSTWSQGAFPQRSRLCWSLLGGASSKEPISNSIGPHTLVPHPAPCHSIPYYLHFSDTFRLCLLLFTTVSPHGPEQGLAHNGCSVNPSEIKLVCSKGLTQCLNG